MCTQDAMHGDIELERMQMLPVCGNQPNEKVLSTGCMGRRKSRGRKRGRSLEVTASVCWTSRRTGKRLGFGAMVLVMTDDSLSSSPHTDSRSKEKCHEMFTGRFLSLYDNDLH